MYISSLVNEKVVSAILTNGAYDLLNAKGRYYSKEYIIISQRNFTKIIFYEKSSL